QKDKKGWDALCYVVGVVERANKPAFTLRAFRQVLLEVYRRLEQTHVTYPAPSRASHGRTLDVIAGYLSEKSGGERMLAVVAALMEVVKTETALFGEVRRAKVTAADKATGMVADIECFDKQGGLLLAVEVKDQQLTLTHVQDKLRNARAKGVKELLFVVQQSLAGPDREGVDRVADKEFASGHNIYVLDLRRLAEGVLALLGERGRTRFLREVGHSLDAYALQVQHRRRWAELLQEM
ncbi:restriction endonuclease, SacI family, partial [candidate division WOR-3 bacterium]|nr:restriction endonuclease, SacI family [candidate division WOR-3 bacterium]